MINVLTRSLMRMMALHLLIICSQLCQAQLSSWKVPLALVARTEQMSLHELSALRLTTDTEGKPVLTFQFSTKKFDAQLMDEHVVLRLGNGSIGEPLIQPLYAARNNQYNIKLDADSAKIVRQFGAEVFIVGQFKSEFFLLSNATIFGPTKPQVSTTPITPKMQQKVAIELQKIKDAGPKYDSVPAGFTVLTKARVATKGMTVQQYSEGRWSSAEYLGKDELGRAVLRVDPTNRNVTVVEAFNVAIDDKQSEIASKNMQAYQPSLELLPESSVVVPEGFMLNAFLRSLVPGVPVRVYVKGEFYDGFVIKADGKNITVRGDRIPDGEVVANFYSVIMTPEVHQKLSKLWFDDLRDYFAKYLSPDNTATPLQAAGRADLEEALVAKEAIEAQKAIDEMNAKASMRDSAASSQAPKSSNSTSVMPPDSKATDIDQAQQISPARKLKSYPMKLKPLPKSSVLTQDVPLKPGVKLGCSWASSWYSVTVVAVYSDSAVRIHWDDFGDAWDCDIARSDLIIADQVKRILERKADAPDVMPRLWKDATEKFKVLAYLESVTETDLRLIKTDGKMLTLPIEKLSEADQAVVGTAKTEQP